MLIARQKAAVTFTQYNKHGSKKEVAMGSSGAQLCTNSSTWPAILLVQDLVTTQASFRTLQELFNPDFHSLEISISLEVEEFLLLLSNLLIWLDIFVISGL